MATLNLTANFTDAAEEAKFLTELVALVGNYPDVSGSWSGSFTASHPDITAVDPGAVGTGPATEGVTITDTAPVGQADANVPTDAGQPADPATVTSDTPQPLV